MDYCHIGNVEIEKAACLAPMASVADKAYRMLCKQMGASYLVSEMISSKGLCFGDKNTAVLCEIEDCERPMALQLFGEDPAYMGRAAEKLMKYNPDIIDINMGCPVPKIVGNGSGSALMKTPKTAFDIVKAVVDNCNCPVTVKIRSGWNADSINAVEMAKGIEQAGASAICVHGRHREQYYYGNADWDIIRQVKQTVSCPVIGNGDVKSADDAVKMYKQTGCDLVMIGRHSYGNPWIFKEVKEYIELGKDPEKISLEEKMDCMLRHGKLLMEFKGEKQGMKEMRKNFSWYIKGLPDSAKLRGNCSEICEYTDLERMAEIIIKRGEDR